MAVAARATSSSAGPRSRARPGWAVIVVDSYKHRNISRLQAYATVCTGMHLWGRERAGDLYAMMEWARARAGPIPPASPPPAGAMADGRRWMR